MGQRVACWRMSCTLPSLMSVSLNTGAGRLRLCAESERTTFPTRACSPPSSCACSVAGALDPAAKALPDSCGLLACDFSGAAGPESAGSGSTQWHPPHPAGSFVSAAVSELEAFSVCAAGSPAASVTRGRLTALDRGSPSSVVPGSVFSPAWPASGLLGSRAC